MAGLSVRPEHRQTARRKLPYRQEVRISEREAADWHAAAAQAKLTVGAWVRRCCQEALELHAALEREADRERREERRDP